MFPKSRVSVTLFAGFMLLAGGALRANADDIVGDFSLPAGNPNGNWSYGYTTSLGGTFNPFSFSYAGALLFLDYWTTESAFPTVGRNISGGTRTCCGTVSFPTDVLEMHPDPSGVEAVVRWTAPSAGTYAINGLFEGLDYVYPTTTDVHILFDSSTSLFNGNISSFESPLGFSLSRTVSLGDTIDFVVGYGIDGSYLGDSTGLSGTITSTAAVPEPEIYAMMGIGLALMGFVARRRKLKEAAAA